MKTDETVTFDYLKADFSILNGRKLCMVAMQPEYTFYFRHRIVHWLNQINESFDPETNYDSIKIDRYMVTDSGRAIAVYGFKNIAGNLNFHYDRNRTFKSISFDTCVGIYNNEKKFPTTSRSFTIEADINLQYELLDYDVERSIDLSETSYDDFIVRYSFTADGKKTEDLLMLYDYTVNNEDMVIADKTDDFEGFDEFFNKNIDSILQSVETFLEIYPQFSIRAIDTDETLKIFYAEMKKMYQEGVFDNGLDKNLAIIKMVTI